MSLRFSINAPCPAGRNSSSPDSVRNGVLSGLTAMVSVEGFCTENDTSYFTPKRSS